MAIYSKYLVGEKVDILPTANIDKDKVYFYPSTHDGKNLAIAVRDSDNTMWYTLDPDPAGGGAGGIIESINGISTADVQLELAFDENTKALTITGGANSVDLSLFALDADVVHNTGDEDIAGTKTFEESPIIPAGTADNHAVNKSQLDDLNSLITQIMASGLKPQGALDVASNPNYPEATEDWMFWIATNEGRIGGASGELVKSGDWIIAKEINAGGTQATVGDSWSIIQHNLDYATMTAPGYIQIADEVSNWIEGNESNSTAVTPSHLVEHLMNYLRVDMKNLDDNLTTGDQQLILTKLGLEAGFMTEEW